MLATPALAAGPPEAPRTEAAQSVTATTAILEGTLNPGSTATVGWYFAYTTEPVCMPSLTTPLEPEVTGKAIKEHIEVTNLEPNKEYTFCIVATNEAGAQATQSTTELKFKTKAIAPTVESETTSTPKATEAHLEAVVNANNQEVTECKFQYGTSPTLAAATTTACEPATLEGLPFGQGVGLTVTGLTQNTTYYYRVSAKNATGETKGTAVEPIEHFTTALPPETPEKVEAEQLTSTTATLKGLLNPKHPGNPGSYEFLYKNTANGAGCEGEGTAGGSATGASPEAVSSEATGLLPNVPYAICLLAHNEAGEASAPSAPVTFTLAAKPTLSAEASSGETKESAVLNGAVDPEGLPVESCVFEYGTSTSYEHSRSCADPDAEELGSGRTAIPVSQTIPGLEGPNKEYHWRLTATNAAGTTTSVDHTFNYVTGSETLPDNRAYEMVTPPFKNGGLPGDVFFGFPPNVSRDGSRVVALDIQCFAPSEACNAVRGNDGEPFEFTRTSSGWATTPLQPPATRFSENAPWLVSAGTEGADLFSMPTGPAGEDEWYGEHEPGSFTAIGPAGPPGYVGIQSFGLGSKHSTTNLSHLVWEIISGPFWPFDETGDEGRSLYEYAGTSNRVPLLVGVSGGFENGKNYNLISTCETRLGNKPKASTWNALSANGDIVYFTAYPEQGGSACPGGAGTNAHKQVPVAELYARVDGETSAAHTVAISQPDASETAGESPPDDNCTEEPCLKNVSGEANWRGATFLGASEDGSRVFFTSEQQLTNQASQGSNNLYEYDLDAPAGHNLIDVSTPERSGESPQVQGVVATSADGSHVYFEAQGVLTSAPSPDAQGFGVHGEAVSTGAVAQPGESNMYVFDTETGHTAFVASLSASDPDLDPEEQVANVTPEGRFLVFASQRDLTPDDTRTDGDAQIFRYDSAGERLVRVSIGNEGYNDDGNAGLGAATIAGRYSAGAGPAVGDPTISDDGAYVFFQSPIALTPHALGDVVAGHEGVATAYAQNVYEYHEGHVYLLSDGHDTSTAHTPCSHLALAGGEKFGSAVCLLGADATGHNVFFTTADQLVPKDTDTQLDIYDARVCEPETGNPCVTEPAPPLPSCDGESCHGIPAATPSSPGGGTLTFNGSGNLTPAPAMSTVKPKALTRAQKLANALKACKKKPKKQRSTCEKKAKKQYGAAKKAKRTSRNRRGN